VSQFAPKKEVEFAACFFFTANLIALTSPGASQAPSSLLIVTDGVEIYRNPATCEGVENFGFLVSKSIFTKMTAEKIAPQECGMLAGSIFLLFAA